MIKRIITKLLPLVMILTFLIPAYSIAEENNSVTIYKLDGLSEVHQVNKKPDGTYEGVAGSRYALWKLKDEDLKPETLDTAAANSLVEKLNKLSIKELLDTYGQPILSEPTKEDGSTTVSGLADGRYYIVEVSVSGMITTDPSVPATSLVIEERVNQSIPVVIDLPFLGVDGELQRDVNIYPKVEVPDKTGKVTLVKYLEEGGSRKLFKGAIFNLYEKVDQGDDILIKVDENGNYINDGGNGTADLVTNEKGEIIVTGLPYGDYYFTEKVPTGYVLTGNMSFTIDDSNKSVTVTAVNKKTDEPGNGGEKFKKVEEKEDGKPLEGAVFKVMIKDEEESTKDKLVLKEYKDASGKSVTARSNAKGEFEFTNLPYGTYYIQETTAPTGYAPLTQAIKIDITKDSYTDGKTFVVVNKKLVPREPGVEPDRPSTTPPTAGRTTPPSGGGGVSGGGGGVTTTPSGPAKPGLTIPTTGDIQIFLYVAAGIAVMALGIYMYRSESKTLKTSIG